MRFMGCKSTAVIVFCVFVFGQARGLDGNVTLIVGDKPQAEFVRSARNIVGVKVLAAKVSRKHVHLSQPHASKVFCRSLDRLFTWC